MVFLLKYTFQRKDLIKHNIVNCSLVYHRLTTMAKRKRHSLKKSQEEDIDLGIHDFNEEEVQSVRDSLLAWYDENKRDLPWRKMASVEDKNRRAYGVWVSEIMLQQTQVTTVIDYYNKWMKKWPDVESLSKASVEEVNEVWSGLGYYSRGRRLYEGAVKVMTELGGHIPTTAEELQKQLPGVGRYTAGAIASIAFGEATGLVDGNVARVFARLRVIGAETTSPAATAATWHLANTTVPPTRPGDYNQALMELGATVCTPKAPLCDRCPVRENCLAHRQVDHHKQKSKSKVLADKNGKDKIPDIECLVDDCKLCLSGEDQWDASAGVQNYPRKDRKKAAREERTAVCVLQREQEGSIEYLMVQRPDKGLLAGMWEFPSVTMETDATDPCRSMDAYLESEFGFAASGATRRKQHGEVVHLFSHIHQTYVVESMMSPTADLDLGKCERSTRWLRRDKIDEAAVSTAMKKVLKCCESKASKKTPKATVKSDGKKQLSMDSFFKPKTTKK